MPEEPQIGVLSYTKRKYFFWFLFLVFVVAMPVLIFYTSGNRLVFDDDATSVVSMGGIYLGNDLDDIGVYVDEEVVEKSRLFRRALYLEDIAAGEHRVHVQRDGLQTWVKELPVYPGIVTESFSFNLPVVPQIRMIAASTTVDGTQVISGLATTTHWFAHASVTNPVLATTTREDPTWITNPEYVYVHELFAATSTDRRSLLERMQLEYESRFSFSSATTTATSSATTTVINRDIALREADGELVAQWQGLPEDAPFYFCIPHEGASTTAERYGAHVALDIEHELASSTASVGVNGRICRETIQLDRSRQDVYLFGFLPGNLDLVLLHLEDGVYVTEIDDRAWQNTQLLYPGRDLRVILDNDQILVFDGTYYFEVLTTLAEAA